MKLKVGRLLWLDVSQQHVQMGRFFLLCSSSSVVSKQRGRLYCSTEGDQTLKKKSERKQVCVTNCFMSPVFPFQISRKSSAELLFDPIVHSTPNLQSGESLNVSPDWTVKAPFRSETDTSQKTLPNLPSSNDLPTAAVKSHTGQMHLQHLLVHTGIALYIKLNGGPEFSHLKRQTLVRSGQKLKHQNSSQTDRSLMLVRSWKLNPVNEPQLWIHSKNHF